MEQRSARILVVDDEEAIRLTLDILLRRRGYTVTTAASGEEAITLIAQYPFDLLLLDFKMSGLSGIDVAQRASELQPSAAILIVTGTSTIEGMTEVPHTASFECMLKTASPQQILERVSAILAGR